MEYTEKLHWILDNPTANIHNPEQKFQENIAFVHSLGLKCDSVGWSTLELADPRAEEILEQIRLFCKKNGWTSRGIYERHYTNIESDWYELTADEFRDSTFADWIKTRSEVQQETHVYQIRAYHETSVAPKRWGSDIFVPEHFRDVWLSHNLEGLDFCWAKDIGKYTAPQYFQVFGKYAVSGAAVAWNLEKQGFFQIRAAGGALPTLTKSIHNLQMIQMPECFLEKDMPALPIAYAYIPMTHSCCGMKKLLIRKDMAQLLLQEKALPAGALKPIPVVTHLPGGYTRKKASEYPRPTADFTKQLLQEYEALKAAPRPVRSICEKDALQALRKAKTERKDDFQKKLSKADVNALAETQYAPILPYYLVANGGFLSDEYQLLPYDAALIANQEWIDSLKAEQLLKTPPEGIVIGQCANADLVLLCTDNTVIRFSHEAPEAVDRWSSVAQFIFNALTETT